MKKFFIVSLPRTGTKSLCKMAKICGFNIKHVPGFSYEEKLKEFNFFADTPCYRPTFIEELCKNEDFDANFIYIEKDPKETFDSWVRVNLYKNYVGLYNDYKDEERKSKMRYSGIYDIESYDEAFSNTFLDQNNFDEIFLKHKQLVSDVIKKYNKNLLVYKFTDGWKPFCDFIGSKQPATEIPYLNKDTMFEKID